MTIRLHQFVRAFGLPNPSPFCVKVETWLRLAGVDYEIVVVTDPRRLPKGKAPVIEHDGRVVADSHFIVRYLTEALGVDLDAELTPEQRRVSHAFARLLEERFYWILVHARWIDPRAWPIMRDALLASIPSPARAAFAAIFRRQVRGRLRAQGLGRHSPAEIWSLAAEDLGAVAGHLGDRPFFHGDAPSTVDTVVYAFASAALLEAFDTELLAAARAHPNLVAYCERMRARCFPDLG